MNYFNMKKSDFKDIKQLSALEEINGFDSVVIIPTRRKHDSGYMCMEFVFCKKGEPIGKSYGGSDVLHLDGIGGYGKWKGYLPEKIKPKGWSIDCLPCGYLRLFARTAEMSAEGLSDFSVYADFKEDLKR